MRSMKFYQFTIHLSLQNFCLTSFTVFWLNEGQRQGDSEVSVSRRKEKNSNRETARGGDVLYDETVTRA
jgi:hypothetical protein